MKPTRLAAALLVLLAATVAHAADAPEITDQQKQIAISQIKTYPGVRDAAVTQEDGMLTLVIVADYAMNAETAKQNGERFVRLVKQFGPDDNPTSEIGAGVYDYLIIVVTPAKKELARGAKVNIAKKITWR